MDNTSLIVLSQQMAARRSLEVIANNLANVSTTAFKHESVKFEDYQVPVQASAADGGGTTNLSFVLDRGVVRDLSEGRLETTGSPLDLAITGNGYFVVQTADGERYTRDGHFMLDAGGRLVTGDGNAVQGGGGDIAVQPEDGAIHIATDGTVSTNQGQIGKLRIVTFADERALQKTGGGLYSADGEPPQAASHAQVRQGMLEKSNVEPVTEIAHMIDVLRAYQSSTDLTQSDQDMLRQAIEKLGNIGTA